MSLWFKGWGDAKREIKPDTSPFPLHRIPRATSLFWTIKENVGHGQEIIGFNERDEPVTVLPIIDLQMTPNRG